MEEFLCASDLCQYLGLSKSTVHKISSRRLIPTYKPFGKLIYFKRSEVNAFIENHRTPSISETQNAVLDELTKLI